MTILSAVHNEKKKQQQLGNELDQWETWGQFITSVIYPTPDMTVAWRTKLGTWAPGISPSSFETEPQLFTSIRERMHMLQVRL